MTLVSENKHTYLNMLKTLSWVELIQENYTIW